MITYKKTTVFNAQCDSMINTINCVGAMGAGLALEFALRYPELEKKYIEDCKKKIVRTGEVKLYEINGEKILNFPTKYDWKKPSNIKWIQEGLEYMASHYKEWNVKSIAVPPLGCSNGGLDFNTQVKPLIEDKLKNIECEVVVCIDPGYPEGKEKEMVEALKSSSIDNVCKELKIASKQEKTLILNKNGIKRFYDILKLEGVGTTTYKKLFQYFYNNKKIESVQLRLF